MKEKKWGEERGVLAMGRVEGRALCAVESAWMMAGGNVVGAVEVRKTEERGEGVGDGEERTEGFLRSRNSRNHDWNECCKCIRAEEGNEMGRGTRDVCDGEEITEGFLRSGNSRNHD